MKSRRRLSVKRFEKRHPGLLVSCLQGARSGEWVATAIRRDDGTFHAIAHAKCEECAIYDLSERCLRLATLEACDRQGWASSNTGEVGVPLAGHHVIKRSVRRLDATENLAGVSADVHTAQHEGKSSPSEAGRPTDDRGVAG